MKPKYTTTERKAELISHQRATPTEPLSLPVSGSVLFSLTHRDLFSPPTQQACPNHIFTLTHSSKVPVVTALPLAATEQHSLDHANNPVACGHNHHGCGHYGGLPRTHSIPAAGLNTQILHPHFQNHPAGWVPSCVTF